MLIASLSDFVGTGSVSLPRFIRPWKLVSLNAVVTVAVPGAAQPVVRFLDGTGVAFMSSAPHLVLTIAPSEVCFQIGGAESQGLATGGGPIVQVYDIVQDPVTGAGTLTAATLISSAVSAAQGGAGQCSAPLPDVWLAPEFRATFSVLGGLVADTITAVRFAFEGGGSLDELRGWDDER